MNRLQRMYKSKYKKTSQYGGEGSRSAGTSYPETCHDETSNDIWWETPLLLACPNKLQEYEDVVNQLTVITHSSSEAGDFKDSPILQMTPYIDVGNLQQLNQKTSCRTYTIISARDPQARKLRNIVGEALRAVENKDKVRIFLLDLEAEPRTASSLTAEIMLSCILQFLLDHPDSHLRVAVLTEEKLYQVYRDVYHHIRHPPIAKRCNENPNRQPVVGITDTLPYRIGLTPGVTITEISPQSSEYQNIIEKMQHIRDVKISRVENLTLLIQYEAQKRKVEWSLAGENSSLPAERVLFHSTNSFAASKICTEEFNRSFAGTAQGTSFGHGTYFSTYPLFCGYKNCVFMARVLTGKFYQGNTSITRVNLLQSFHSTVDNVNSPRTFVVYHDAAAYPEYLIEPRN